MRAPAFALALAALAGAGVASAEDWDSFNDRRAARVQINAILVEQAKQRAARQQISRSSVPGGVAVASRQRMPVSITGAVADIDFVERVPYRGIAGAVARSLPIIGAGLAIAELLEQARVREGFGGGVEVDLGAAAPEQPGWSICNNVSCTESSSFEGWYTSPSQAYARDSNRLCQQWINQGGGTYDCVGTPTCTITGPTASCTGVVRRQLIGDFVAAQSPVDLDYYRNDAIGAPTPRPCPEGQSQAWWDVTKCTTAPGNWTGFHPQAPQVLDRLEQNFERNPALAPTALDLLHEFLIGARSDPPAISGPSSIHDGRAIVQNPDGSVTVRDTWRDLVYFPNDRRIEVGTRVEERSFPPGDPIPEPGQPGGAPGPVTTIPPGSAPEGQELLVCGLPWTPPCKIDEQGTPSTIQQPGDPASILDPIRDAIETPAELSWTWSFQLPTACSAITLGAFEPFGVTVDLCQWQPVIHDMMSIVWVMFGLFGALSIGRWAIAGV